MNEELTEEEIERIRMESKRAEKTPREQQREYEEYLEERRTRRRNFERMVL